MTKEIVAALLTSGASILLALFSLLTARSARERALAAEDSAKQTELIRSKGLSAIEEITFSLGKILEIVRTMGLMVDTLSNQEFVDQFSSSLHKFVDAFINAHYRSIVYLDESLASEFTAIRETFLHQPTSREALDRQFQELKKYLESTTRQARDRYLPIAIDRRENRRAV